MSTETGGIGDTEPQAQLVDCAPIEPDVLAVDVSAPDQPSPVRDAMVATIGQTGADPPPPRVG